MLSIVLKILFILGILLLCILGLAIAFVLLVLFFPICYKISGKKDAEQISIHVRASWLLGFLRVCFDYPDPGKLLIKLLFFTVFDTGKESGGKAEKDSKGNSVKAAEKKEKRKKTGSVQKQRKTKGRQPEKDRSLRCLTRMKEQRHMGLPQNPAYQKKNIRLNRRKNGSSRQRSKSKRRIRKKRSMSRQIPAKTNPEIRNRSKRCRRIHRSFSKKLER